MKLALIIIFYRFVAVIGSFVKIKREMRVIRKQFPLL